MCHYVHQGDGAFQFLEEEERAAKHTQGRLDPGFNEQQLAVLEDTEVLVGQRDAEINNIGKCSYDAMMLAICLLSIFRVEACSHLRLLFIQNLVDMEILAHAALVRSHRARIPNSTHFVTFPALQDAWCRLSPRTKVVLSHCFSVWRLSDDVHHADHSCVVSPGRENVTTNSCQYALYSQQLAHCRDTSNSLRNDTHERYESAH